MERLGGQDAAFLALETPTTHLHLAAAAVFAPQFDHSTPPERGGVIKPSGGIVEFTNAVRARLARVPALRRRLVEVPLGLNHPVWADDPEFDVDDHVRRAALPSPGGADELADFAAGVMGRPLDRRRPVWEAHVVEGLQGGMVAVIMKVHHAMVDGLAAARLALGVLDLEPDAAVAPDDVAPGAPQALPSPLELIADAVSDLRDQRGALAQMVGPTVDAARQLWERRGSGAEGPPRLFSAPRTSLNVTVTPERRVGLAQLPLDDVSRVRRAFGTTVNDVVLALCSAALRAYLAGREESPAGDLVAMVPASARRREEETNLGNRLSFLLVRLATPVEDPAERLLAIHDAMTQSRADGSLASEELIGRWGSLAVPAVATPVARLASRLRLAEWGRPPFNVIVSSLPGPAFPLYLAAAPMTALYPMGPICDGVGLNITVVRYLDRLNVGVVADRKALPDVAPIADGLARGLDELVKAADQEGGPAGPP